MPLIKCEKLCFAYEGVNVLQDVDFEINKGDYICVVGENGAGKSTLIKGLLGLKKQSSGSMVFGEGLKSTEIGYLPQQTNIQRDFPASVYEVVLSGCLNGLKLSPFYSKKHRQMALNNMERLNILNLKNKSYQELSGGQQQRVLLARALCSTSKIILLDEPVAGLDPIVTQELYKLVDDINKNLDIAVIMVSHDIHSAVKNAKLILHISNKLMFFGKTENYVQSEVGRRFIGEQHE